MSFENWLAFCAVEAALCFTPGPAVLFVMSASLAGGTRAGLAGTAGILAGNLLYFVLAAAGVAAIILASPTFFTAIKWTGAAYLVWLGIRMLLARSDHFTSRPHYSTRGAFARALAVQLANPKAIAFFVALLPQFLTPAESIGRQILVLAASSVVIEAAVLAFYVTLTVRARAYAGARWAAPATRVAGAFLVGAGARLAWLR